MKISTFIRKDYPVIDAYSGLLEARKALQENNALVVEEEGIYVDVLTRCDLALHPHNLVFDCLSKKMKVPFNSTVENVFQLMQQEKEEVLPVFDRDEFKGLIYKADIVDYVFNDVVKLETILKENLEEAQSLDENLKQIVKDTNTDWEKVSIVKDRFLLIIAHDIKNLFQQVIGMLEMLSKNIEHSKDEQNKSLIRLTTHSANQINSVFESLISWAKVQTGKIPYAPEPIDLYGLFDKIKTQYAAAARQKNILITNHLNHKLSVFADRNMLVSILLNLVYNAIKFTPEKGMIWMNAEKISEDTLELTIADNGIGIDENIKNKLFNSEAEAGNGGTNGESGTGIGLMLCREFVNQHGGKIWIESEKGKGTEIKFTLPLANENILASH